MLRPLSDCGRAFKKLKLNDLTDVTKFWLESLCEGAVASVQWVEGAYDGTDFTIGLTDKNGQMGSFVVKLKDGAELNPFMKDMLEVTGDMVQQAADDLDGVKMDDGEPDWVPEGMKGVKGLRGGKMAAKMALPSKLVKYARSVITSMPLKVRLASAHPPPL